MSKKHKYKKKCNYTYIHKFKNKCIILNMREKSTLSIVDTVIERLRKKARPQRKNRTLVLTVSTYEKFEQVCRHNKWFPSEVIDEFITLFVEERSRKK